jgi:3-phosphoshikimate 1-carboxyvinyltransferase
MNRTIHPITAAQGLRGSPVIPGDKSVSHRSLMFGALARGTTTVTHLLESGDVHSTWGCLEAMGARIRREERSGGSHRTKVIIEGGGMLGLRAPAATLDCGNSGTTIRLLMGILSGQPFAATLTGDQSLRKRPMKRIAEPLRSMGASIELTEEASRRLP